MSSPVNPQYRHDLALIHHAGFGSHAVACAPGILALLAPVRERRGVVLELGCGSGILTRELIAAGHRVIATDASPAMLDIAQDALGGEADLRLLVLPDDPLPEVDAVVSVGHVLNYLPDAGAIDRALAAIAAALLPASVLAIDICDMEYGRSRRSAPPYGRAAGEWAIITEYSTLGPDRFIRDMTTFVRAGDESWRRDREHHENVLIDTDRIPGLLLLHGVNSAVRRSFGSEQLPPGMRAVIGRRP